MKTLLALVLLVLGLRCEGQTIYRNQMTTNEQTNLVVQTNAAVDSNVHIITGTNIAYGVGNTVEADGVFGDGIGGFSGLSFFSTQSGLLNGFVLPNSSIFQIGTEIQLTTANPTTPFVVSGSVSGGGIPNGDGIVQCGSIYSSNSIAPVAYKPLGFTNGTQGVNMTTNTFYTNTFGQRGMTYIIYTNSSGTGAGGMLGYLWSSNGAAIPSPGVPIAGNVFETISAGLTNTLSFCVGPGDYFSLTNIQKLMAVETNVFQGL